MTDVKTPSTSSPTISVDTLASAIAAAMKASQPTAGMLTGMSEGRLERAQGKHDKPLRHRVVPGRSPDTGATFDQAVVESRSFPTGRVVRLENYTHPPDAYVSMAEGGRMPDGLSSYAWQGKGSGQPGHDAKNNELSVPFKQWRYEQFWKRDLANIVGRPLRPEMCLDGTKALDTPWELSSLYADKAAE